MRYSINIDPAFTPSIGSRHIPFESFTFSGGEIHIKINSLFSLVDVDVVYITNRIINSDDVMKILLIKDALERLGINRFELVVPYLPYARQDRVCNNGEAFSLKVFTTLINNANFNAVHIWDPHSDVSSALLNNCVVHSITPYVIMSHAKILSFTSDDIVLVSPDAGANKKVNVLYNELSKFNMFKDLVKCDKSRNTIDGALSNFEVFSGDLKGASCLIVDDICDGGRTFIGIAKALKEKKAGNIYLYVTHGIFSNGFSELGGYFEKIFTTNSFNGQHQILEQYKIQL